MEKVKPKFEYTVQNGAKNKIPVIVVAAGNATRMRGIDKQMLALGGMPVLARTLSVFEKCESVSKIIIVTKEENILAVQNLCREYLISKVTDIVSGGDSRHKSVLCGMERLGKGDNKVLIHDGARPFLSEKMITDCIEALFRFDGCLCALKVSDTVKRADSELTVEKTVDRSSLYLAQTPQGVDVKIYKELSEKFAGTEFTDDASVLEAGGKTVKIVAGERKNIKITTREDIAFANAVLAEMGETK